MTEIEFLVQVLLTESVSDVLKEKLLKRIEEVEKGRNLQPTITPAAPIYPQTVPWITYGPTCQHEYEPYGYHVGDFPPRRCKKCQQSEHMYGGSISGIITTISGASVINPTLIKNFSTVTGNSFVNN